MIDPMTIGLAVSGIKLVINGIKSAGFAWFMKWMFEQGGN